MTIEHTFAKAHSVDDNVVWRLECTCGFTTAADFFPLAGEELHDHWTREHMSAVRAVQENEGRNLQD